MGRRAALAALLLVIATSLALAARSAGGPPPPSARAHRLSAQLRCPVCQGLSVADSPSSTARAIAEDISRRVAAGESDVQIRRDYVQRYGAWILLTPTASGLSALVWLLPALLVLVGVVGLAVAFRRWSTSAPALPTEADRALVDRARARPVLEPRP